MTRPGGQEETVGSLAVELGSRRVREPTDSSGRLPPNAAAARYWFPSDGIAASAFRFLQE